MSNRVGDKLSIKSAVLALPVSLRLHFPR
uniref:Uncharacterized protein n=1 Tax=Anguilla anguilla TaxID=7936 RepID=A0A0E9QPU7_ANGAN